LIKIILIDRDGVINKKSKKSRYVEKWDDFIFKKTSVKAMKKLSDLGANFIVITNQAGISRGNINLSDLKLIHKNITRELKYHGINIIDIFFCPHKPEENCFCRKPNPGMFYEASKKWFLRLDKTVYIGDDITDMDAAENAGCYGIFLSSEKNIVFKNHKIVKTCNDLNNAVYIINSILDQQYESIKNIFSSFEFKRL